MNELTIDPSVKLTDPEAAAALDRKRQELFNSQYRPKNPLAEHWPPVPSGHLFDLRPMRLVKR